MAISEPRLCEKCHNYVLCSCEVADLKAEVERLEKRWADLITALNIMARMPPVDGHALLVEELATRAALEAAEKEAAMDRQSERGKD